MSINPSEVTKLLKEQIKNFGEKAEVSEIGKFYQSVTELQEHTVWTMFKLERWLSLKTALKVWH